MITRQHGVSMSASWHAFLSRFFCVLVSCAWVVSAQSDFIPLAGPLPPTVSKGEAPYLVTDYLEVEEGGHTIIEKGVIFLFKNFTGINVKGTIRVEGTSTEPVVFTSENDTVYNPFSTLEPAAFDWDGISINQGEMENVFEYCIIQYSLFGIKCLTPKIALKECEFKDNGNADFALEGENLLVTSPYSYKEGDERVMPDITKTETSVEVVAPEEGPSLETDTGLVLEEPEEERKKRRKKKASLASDEPKKEKVAGKVLFRLGSVLAAFAGGGFGAKEHLGYLEAKETFDDINEFDDEDKLKYTSEDWENEKQHTESHQKKMFIFYGIGALGLSLFVVSFAF